MTTCSGEELLHELPIITGDGATVDICRERWLRNQSEDDDEGQDDSIVPD